MYELVRSGSHEIGKTSFDEEIDLLEGMLISPTFDMFGKYVCMKYLKLAKLGVMDLYSLVEEILDHNRNICLQISEAEFSKYYPSRYQEILDGDDYIEDLIEHQDTVMTDIEQRYFCLSLGLSEEIKKVLKKNKLGTRYVSGNFTGNDQSLIFNDGQISLFPEMNTLQVIGAINEMSEDYDECISLRKE